MDLNACAQLKQSQNLLVLVVYSERRLALGTRLFARATNPRCTRSCEITGNLMTSLTQTMGVIKMYIFLLLTLLFHSGRFFKCPPPTCRRPRCPATSDCCDGNSVSSIAASYAEQVTPYPVTVTELSLALCFFFHDSSLILVYPNP